jgi:hypothetical protein
MSELDLLRDVAATPAPASPRSRARARASLFTKIEASERCPRRAWFFSLTGAVATAGVAAVAFFSLGAGGSQPALAAPALLHKAATAALAQPGLGTLKPGQYIYTKSVDAYLNTTELDRDRVFSALVPNTREVWLAADGTGWLHEKSGKPTFLSERDRQRWIAAGRPDLGSGQVIDVALRNEDGLTPPMSSLDLPTDTDALYAKLEKQAGGQGNWVYREMFVLIGDSLRENYTTPAQRAALYEVAARLPGVELIGNVKDAVGRTGIGVAMDNKAGGFRNALIFDSVNYGLLGEQTTALSGNAAGYPAGMVTGHGAYLEQAVVDAIKKRP